MKKYKNARPSVAAPRQAAETGSAVEADTTSYVHHTTSDPKGQVENSGGARSTQHKAREARALD